ncbi:MAG: hypothetical protein ACE5E1_11125, partial [Phycisphaerae bacterium]
MTNRWCFPTIGLAVIVAVSPPLFARDVLKRILTQDKLTAEDRATIEAEVEQRAYLLADAGADEQRRQSARDALIAPIRIPKATKVGLAAYAQACADELSILVTSAKLDLAFDATLVLVALDNPRTADALALALLSDHGAVRYRAARGIQLLHKDIAKDRGAVRTVLRALGRAGASEKSEAVLRMLYAAIDFNADVPGFKHADECAKALNAVFAARIKQLGNGSHDEWKDEIAYGAAAACYAKASPSQQKELVRHMAAFLTHHVDRYYDTQTAGSFRPTLARLIAAAERSLRAMMRSSNVQPPSQRVQKT